MDDRQKTIIKILTKALILMVSLGYICYVFWSQRGEIKTVFNLKPAMIAIILAMQFGYVVIHAYRYRIVLEKCSRVSIPFSPWLKLFILGRFLNKFIPQLGNIYRSIQMKKEFNISYTTYIAGFASFGWMDVVLGFIIALLVIFSTDLHASENLRRITPFLFLFTIVLAVTPFVFSLLFRSLHFRNNALSWLHRKLSEVLDITLTNLKSFSYVLNIILTGILLFVYMSILFYVSFVSLGIQVNLAAMVIFYALFKLSNHVNITPGNLGIQEIAYGVLGEMLNIGMAQGIAVSAVLRIAGFIVLLISGMYLGGFGLLKRNSSIARPDRSCSA